MVPDLLIWLGALGAFIGWCGLMAWFTRKRPDLESPAPDPVPVALRLDADVRERFSRAHVRPVRPSDGRVVRFRPSPIQRSAIADSKKRRG